MNTKALLIYPEIPATYWSFRYALPFIAKKASMPPIGLLTVASLLPDDYNVRLIDMNVTRLKKQDIMEADIVMTSSMILQKKSLEHIIQLCNHFNKPVIAGGPYPTGSFQKIAGVNHFVLNEAEITLPQFLHDYHLGKAKPIYFDETKPDITATPPPRFDLINMNDYAAMALQYSRGCPFSCEFCDIIEMFGRNPRTKTPEQFLIEMDTLHGEGYDGSLFIVDDNFIGNKKNVKKLLPQIADWQIRNNYPFKLFTEASMNLANDDVLMDMMVDAGFNMVFLGIETPVKESLTLVGKKQNLKQDLLESVYKIQQKGMEVTGGFIIGFDNDPEDIFDRQIHFIRKAGIPVAMVGLLTAIPHTQLYRRLKSENRLINDPVGNNTHEFRLNFMPKMDINKLVNGYKRVISEIYKPEVYFQRCLNFIRNLNPQKSFNRKLTLAEFKAFLLSLTLQTFSRYGWQYWKFIIKSLFIKPKLFSETVTMAIKGHHFFKITREVLAVDNFRIHLEKITQVFREKCKEIPPVDMEEKLNDLISYRDMVVKELRKEYRRLHKDFQYYVEDALQNFEMMIDEIISEMTGLIPQKIH